jgi:hypothetical protein
MMNINHDLKDKAILACWVMGIIILISIIWVPSQRIQANFLMRTINNVLVNSSDSRRVSEFIQKKPVKPGLFGYWYSINNSVNQMFVFTVFQDGILVPLGAIVSSDGSVDEVIPLSSHAVQIFNNIPQRVLQIYISKIEASDFKDAGGNKK